MLLAQISLTLSHHSSLSSITSDRSSRLHPVSIKNYCRWVLIGHPTLAQPCEGVHRRTLLMSLSLLLYLCPTCLIWMVLEMGGRRPYNCCFVGCYFQDLFRMTHSILVQFLSSFFSIRLVSIHVVHPYSRINTTTVWKKLCFILSDRFDFYMIDNLSIAVHAFASHILMLFSVDETLLPK